jgi:hypothetical protein
MKTERTEYENAAEARRALLEAAKQARGRLNGDGSSGEIVTGYRTKKRDLALYEIKQVS